MDKIKNAFDQTCVWYLYIFTYTDTYIKKLTKTCLVTCYNCQEKGFDLQSSCSVPKNYLHNIVLICVGVRHWPKAALLIRRIKGRVDMGW